MLHVQYGRVAHNLVLSEKQQEMTTPFGIVVVRSQVLYKAAQNPPQNTDIICQIVMRIQRTVTIGKAVLGMAVLGTNSHSAGVRLAQEL